MKSGHYCDISFFDDQMRLIVQEVVTILGKMRDDLKLNPYRYVYMD
jgi:hypothetical protein